MEKKGGIQTYEECFNTANRKISSVSCFSVMTVSIFKKCHQHQDIRQLLAILGSWWKSDSVKHKPFIALIIAQVLYSISYNDQHCL